MRILITGAKGYLGSTLNKVLERNFQVTAISREDFDLTNSHETEQFFAHNLNFDVVLHCASIGIDNPRSENWKILDDNLRMYYNLLENNNNFKKLINFGTGAETDNVLNQFPYGMSKNIIAKSIADTEGFYNIRLFGLFNENELDKRFIKSSLRRYINREPIIIHENKLMDFFYMDDLIKVVGYYINNIDSPDLPKELNCCYEHILSLKNIANNIINNLSDYKVEIIVESQNRTGYKSDCQFPLKDIELTGLDQGIKEVYEKLKNEYKN